MDRIGASEVSLAWDPSLDPVEQGEDDEEIEWEECGWEATAARREADVPSGAEAGTEEEEEGVVILGDDVMVFEPVSEDEEGGAVCAEFAPFDLKERLMEHSDDYYLVLYERLEAERRSAHRRAALSKERDRQRERVRLPDAGGAEGEDAGPRSPSSAPPTPSKLVTRTTSSASNPNPSKEDLHQRRVRQYGHILRTLEIPLEEQVNVSENPAQTALVHGWSSLPMLTSCKMLRWENVVLEMRYLQGRSSAPGTGVRRGRVASGKKPRAVHVELDPNALAKRGWTNPSVEGNELFCFEYSEAVPLVQSLIGSSSMILHIYRKDTLPDPPLPCAGAGAGYVNERNFVEPPSYGKAVALDKDEPSPLMTNVEPGWVYSVLRSEFANVPVFEERAENARRHFLLVEEDVARPRRAVLQPLARTFVCGQVEPSVRLPQVLPLPLAETWLKMQMFHLFSAAKSADHFVSDRALAEQVPGYMYEFSPKSLQRAVREVAVRVDGGWVPKASRRAGGGGARQVARARDVSQGGYDSDMRSASTRRAANGSARGMGSDEREQRSVYSDQKREGCADAGETATAVADEGAGMPAGEWCEGETDRLALNTKSVPRRNAYAQMARGQLEKLNATDIIGILSYNRGMARLLNESRVPFALATASVCDILEVYRLLIRLWDERLFDPLRGRVGGDDRGTRWAGKGETLHTQMRAMRYIVRELEATPWFLTHCFHWLFREPENASTPFSKYVVMQGLGFGDPTLQGKMVSLLPSSKYRPRGAGSRLGAESEHVFDSEYSNDFAEVEGRKKRKRSVYEDTEKQSISGTENDIRILSQEQLGRILEELGIPGDMVKTIPRWDRTWLIRKIATDHPNGHLLVRGKLEKYVRPTLNEGGYDSMRQKYGAYDLLREEVVSRRILEASEHFRRFREDATAIFGRFVEFLREPWSSGLYPLGTQPFLMYSTEVCGSEGDATAVAAVGGGGAEGGDFTDFLENLEKFMLRNAEEEGELTRDWDTDTDDGEEDEGKRREENGGAERKAKRGRRAKRSAGAEESVDEFRESMARWERRKAARQAVEDRIEACRRYFADVAAAEGEAVWESKRSELRRRVRRRTVVELHADGSEEVFVEYTF